MVCKIGFTNWNAKIALLRASMVVTYYIKLFRTGTGQTQRFFNVSTPFSLRDNYSGNIFKKECHYSISYLTYVKSELKE